MKTTFIRPGWGRMACTGTLLHRTASMAFTEGRVADAEDVLLAHATGTFKFARGLAVGGEGGRRIQKPAASD
jgi:acyl-coenzyme A thioesterase PaaI-like protein